MIAHYSRLRLAYAWWLRHAPGAKTAIRGRNNRVEWADAHLHGCRLSINGDDNLLEFGPDARIWNATIELTGCNLACRIGAGTRLRGGTFIVTDEHSRLEIGDHTTMIGPVLVAQGGGRVAFGRDCLVSFGADVRCSDGHSVLEAGTGRSLNPAADILVGDHVWIGHHSQVLKGVTVADHAIVAARSVVTNPVPAGTIVAGNPARPVRSGVTWDLRRPSPAAAPAPVSSSHAALPLRQGA